MVRKRLNEDTGNFVVDFVRKVFDAIINQRNKAIQRAAEKDPQFKEITARLQRGHDDLVKWAEERAKTDQSFADAWKRYGDIEKM